ncbi:hypothetical protein AURDEDRAFT_167804 [Auricularia subglabra TFB-10046 SS5]|nr:hypothetical protein AURDEDRAFT_167804 [Auricularia subglabra TFB-10046 SS5]
MQDGDRAKAPPNTRGAKATELFFESLEDGDKATLLNEIKTRSAAKFATDKERSDNHLAMREKVLRDELDRLGEQERAQWTEKARLAQKENRATLASPAHLAVKQRALANEIKEFVEKRRLGELGPHGASLRGAPASVTTVPEPPVREVETHGQENLLDFQQESQELNAEDEDDEERTMSPRKNGGCLGNARSEDDGEHASDDDNDANSEKVLSGRRSRTLSPVEDVDGGFILTSPSREVNVPDVPRSTSVEGREQLELSVSLCGQSSSVDEGGVENEDGNRRSMSGPNGSSGQKGQRKRKVSEALDDHGADGRESAVPAGPSARSSKADKKDAPSKAKKRKTVDDSHSTTGCAKKNSLGRELKALGAAGAATKAVKGRNRGLRLPKEFLLE